MDGISKWNMITGKQRSTDNFELIHNINGNTMGIRKGPWKFIRSKIPESLINLKNMSQVALLLQYAMIFPLNYCNIK